MSEPDLRLLDVALSEEEWQKLIPQMYRIISDAGLFRALAAVVAEETRLARSECMVAVASGDFRAASVAVGKINGMEMVIGKLIEAAMPYKERLEHEDDNS